MKKAEQGAVVATGDAGFPALAEKYKFLSLTNPAIIRETLGDENINPSDLDRVKFPSGGGTAWMVPTLEGDLDNQKTLEGIVVQFRDVRTFWASDYTGDSAPPDCASADGKVGVGTPGGCCDACPMAQWGSGKNGGQACKASRMLFLMTEGSILPLVVTVPPTSIGITRKFFMRLLRKQIPFYGGILSLGLEQARNKGGIAYSQVKPALVRQLEQPEMEAVRAYATAIRNSLNEVTIDRSEVDHPDAE